MEQLVLEEAPSYHTDLLATSDEELAFIRGGAFKKVVPRAYHYTCAISRLRIETTSGAQMVDACHIEPFAIGGDDHISNGISLCPNLHRAFDRGLLAINSEYRVVVSANFQEDASNYGIRQFEGRKILLPKERAHWPQQVWLAWHRSWWSLI